MNAILFSLMLSLLLAGPFLVKSSQSKFTVILEGACKDVCDLNRPSSYPAEAQKPFIFECTDTENENCSKSCISCPAQVCDEYARKTAFVTYFSYAFHCPPVVLPTNGKCYNRCDLNRYKGSRQDYSFSCKDDISPDKRSCYTCDDGNCPATVCKPNEDKNDHTEYYCPYDISESVCEERCDRNRGHKNVKPYELPCSSQSDESVCKAQYNLCPNYIKSGDGSTYNCPHPQMIGFDECRQLCNEHRQYNDNEYIFNCNEHYNNSTCAFFCTKCPHYVCNPKSGDNRFSCPKKENPSLAYFTQQRWYKGKCKDRCDKSRGGGTYAFELKCESRYSSEQEKALCINECTNECPEDVCMTSTNTILCKEMIWEIDKVEKEKEEFKISLESEYIGKKNSIHFKHSATVITLIVLLIITILATSVFVWCTLRKKKVAPEVVNGRTLSMQEVHSIRELSSSETSASTVILEKKPEKGSLSEKHPKYPRI